MKNKTQMILGLLVVALMVAGFTLTGQVTKEEKVKVGVMTPLTGAYAFLGDNVQKSVELALIEQGLEDQVELIIVDAGNPGDGKSAITAYNKLTQIDKVKVIIDGMSSDGTMAVAPLLEKDEVVMITPLTGGENIDTASSYLFRNGPSDIKAGTLPAKDLCEQGYKNVALYTDKAEYTIDISKHFKNTFQGEIVLDEEILSDKKDYRTEVTKLEKSEYGAIVINTASDSAAYIIKELHENGNNKPIFVNFLGYNANALDVAGIEAYEGVNVYDPELDENLYSTKSFFENYVATYNHAPTIPFHTTGTYDALRMIVEAQDSVGNDGSKIRTYLLENIQGWQGMNGVVSFDERGNTGTGFVLKQVINGELI